MVTNATEVERRIKRLKSLLAVSGLSGVIITKKSDVRYFSGFTGDDSVLLIVPRKKYLITDSRYTEEAEQTVCGFEIAVWKEHPFAFAGSLLDKRKIRKIGASFNDLTVTAARKLSAGGIELAPVDSIISKIREEKSEWEIRKISSSIKVIEKAFREFKSHISIGMTEKDIRLELEWQMYAQGADKTSFETIVAEGKNSSLPHAHAGKRKISRGSILLIDFGGVVDGYCSDLTRTLFIGDVSEKWRKRYEIVLAAQKAGIKNLKAGVELKTADEAARAVFAAADCEDKYVHSLGHGVGLDVHESPRISVKSPGKIVAGSVITVEPGLYYSGEGGIRIEDMVVTMRDGTRVLSRLEKNLESSIVS